MKDDRIDNPECDITSSNIQEEFNAMYQTIEEITNLVDDMTEEPVSLSDDELLWTKQPSQITVEELEPYYQELLGQFSPMYASLCEWYVGRTLLHNPKFIWPPGNYVMCNAIFKIP